MRFPASPSNVSNSDLSTQELRQNWDCETQSCLYLVIVMLQIFYKRVVLLLISSPRHDEELILAAENCRNILYTYFSAARMTSTRSLLRSFEGVYW